MIDGETSAACALVDGQSLTVEQAQALLDGSPNVYRATLTLAQRSEMDNAHAVPINANVAMTPLADVTYLGSHPRHSSAVENVDLAFNEIGLVISVAGERWETVYWEQITSVSADNRESVERRITATRVALFGAVGLFAKKERTISYLIVVDSAGDWMFAVPKVSAMELRAWAKPAQARILRDRPVPPSTPSRPIGPTTVESSVLDIEQRLARLDVLRERGAITHDEHASRRAKIIDEL